MYKKKIKLLGWGLLLLSLIFFFINPIACLAFLVCSVTVFIYLKFCHKPETAFNRLEIFEALSFGLGALGVIVWLFEFSYSTEVGGGFITMGILLYGYVRGQKKADAAIAELPTDENVVFRKNGSNYTLVITDKKLYIFSYNLEKEDDFKGKWKDLIEEDQLSKEFNEITSIQPLMSGEVTNQTLGKMLLKDKYVGFRFNWSDGTFGNIIVFNKAFKAIFEHLESDDNLKSKLIPLKSH